MSDPELEKMRMQKEMEDARRKHELELAREETNRAMALRGPAAPIINNANCTAAAGGGGAAPTVIVQTGPRYLHWPRTLLE
jgi:hypothetical protein